MNNKTGMQFRTLLCYGLQIHSSDKGEITEEQIDKIFMEFMTMDLRFDVNIKEGFSKMGISLMLGRKLAVERKGHNHPGPKMK